MEVAVMVVRDLMHRGLYTCPPETRLGDAARLLVEHHVHAVVVADEGGEPLGVLSDTDLLTGEWLGTDEESLAVMQELTAGELMTSPAATIDADTPAADAAARLRREHVSRLVVTEAGRPVGVIAVSDLVGSLATPSGRREAVADVMSWGIVTCLPETPLPAAARAMQERRSRSVLVVDRSGAPLGIVTGHDLLAIYENGASDATVADLMHPPLTIGPGASLREAADQMLRHEVHRLIVVADDDQAQMPLGLISTSDIVVEMAAAESVWQA
jgi:CBS domain-containing protein